MAEDTIQTTGNQVPEENSAAPVETRDQSRYLVPPVDIFETEQALVVMADLPGVEHDGLHVRVDEGVLTIEGHTRRTESPDALLREFELADYFRQFRLSDQIDPEKISAELKNGVLTLNLAKAEPAKPRQIQVRVG